MYRTSPYSFFARVADPTKLLVYFQGGGACFNGDSCSLDRYPSYRPRVGDWHPNNEGGIFELDNPGSPFADYSMVYVSYCAGDVHLGDKEVTYDVAAAEHELQEGQNPAAHTVTIKHKGHRNAMAALEWTYAKFAKAETV